MGIFDPAWRETPELPGELYDEADRYPEDDDREVVTVWVWDCGAFIASDMWDFDAHYAGLVRQFGDPSRCYRRVR